MLVDLIQHYDHRRVAAEALDALQPVLRLFILAAVQYQYVDRALGRKN